MVARPTGAVRPETVGGLPGWRLSLPNGDSVLVAEHGAQVLSWAHAGVERLYLSPRAMLDGRAAIRGGVPVCWPQFNDRGPLAKHGFARQRRWHRAEAPSETSTEPSTDTLTLALDGAARPEPTWPHAYRAMLSIQLAPGTLTVRLTVHNPGAEAWAFTGALHTYLAVSDIAAVSVHGLGGRPGWDALTGSTAPGPEPLRFDAEFDRVYHGPAAEITVADGERRLRVRQGGGWHDTVVWNPWAAKGASLADMPADGWRRMLCIEAAQVFEPATVAPGASWHGWQTLQVG